MTESSRWVAWVLPLLLILLCLALYLRSVGFPLVGFDDEAYLHQDPRLRDLSLASLGRILSEPFFANYHPVTTLTYALDTTLWGSWLPGFRLTHLALYAIGVVTLFWVYRDILKSPGWAFAAAALFAAHATHVEVVAWLATRKDVVCLVFYTGCILTYARYSLAEKARWGLYVASVGLALLACLSKGYTVILFGLLFAFDLCFGRGIGKRQLLDKLPFVAVGLFVTAMTVSAQSQVSALVQLNYTTTERYVLLAKVFATYVGKTLLPIHLSAMYVVGKAWLSGWVATLGVLLGALAVAGFFLLRRRAPAVAFGIVLFLLPVATVMNIFFTLRVWIADRYLFFPTMGGCLALAALVKLLHERLGDAEASYRRRIAPLAFALLVAVFAGLTTARLGVYRDAVALWSDAVRKNTGLPGQGPVTAADIVAFRAQARPSRVLVELLASAYGKHGDDAEAQALLQSVDKPDSGELVWANAALQREDLELAVQLGREIGRRGGWDGPEGWQTAGAALEKMGDVAGSLVAYEEAARAMAAQNRSPTRAYVAAALLAERLGDKQAALADFEAALSAENDLPRRVELFIKAGVLAEDLGQNDRALGHLNGALQLAPEHREKANVLLRLGEITDKLGRSQEALDNLEAVLRAAPNHPEHASILLKIGQLAEKTGNDAKALASYSEALRVAPDHPSSVAVRARIQLLERRPPRAATP